MDTITATVSVMLIFYVDNSHRIGQVLHRQVDEKFSRRNGVLTAGAGSLTCPIENDTFRVSERLST